MSLIWAIVTGLVLSFVMKSGWGFFIGIFVGPWLYRLFNRLAPINNTQPNPILFLTVAFEVLGHLSKAKGTVTQNDIQLANDLMDSLNLDREKRKLAQDSFNRGKSANYPLRERLQLLYSQYRYRRNVLKVFCEQLIRAAISDGSLHEKEQQILFIVAEEFRIPRAQMAMYIQMMMASYQFQQGGGSQQYQYYQQHQQNQHYGNYQQGGYQQGNYRQSSQRNIDNAYSILGVKSTDDVAVIKRAYRKQMNEHHPDKLVSKGLPPEMLEAAKKRAQEIQAAYDLIKAQRGFK